MPMRRYMGTSIASQKTKKRKKSSAMKTPSMPVCSTRNQTQYSFTRFSIAVQDERSEIQPSSVVSMMSRNEMPSMPSTYPAPMEGIQLLAVPSINLKGSGSPLLTFSQNIGTSGSEIRKPARAKMLAIQRIASLFSLETNKSRIAPTSGVKRMMERM